MNHYFKSKALVWRVIFASMFVLSLLALTPGAALADDFPPVLDRCMNFYQDPINCTAEDVRIERILEVEFTDYCDDEPLPGMMYDTLDATFTLLVSAENSPDRYDIGLFIAKNGNSATDDGICYRDYLAAPLTTPTGTQPILTDLWGGGIDGNEPDGVLEVYEDHTLIPETAWWDADGDACGDMPAGTQVFVTKVKVEGVACSDSLDDEGTLADVSICMSYDNIAKNNCSGLVDAFPGTPAKCACTVLDFPFTPTALTQMSMEASSAAQTTTLVWGALGLLLVVGATGSYLLRRKHARIVA